MCKAGLMCNWPRKKRASCQDLGAAEWATLRCWLAQHCQHPAVLPTRTRYLPAAACLTSLGRACTSLNHLLPLPLPLSAEHECMSWSYAELMVGQVSQQKPGG